MSPCIASCCVGGGGVKLPDELSAWQQEFCQSCPTWRDAEAAAARWREWKDGAAAAEAAAAATS